MGGAVLWARRSSWWATAVAAAGVAGSAWWAFVLLGRSAAFLPWLRPTVLVLGIAAALALLVSGLLSAGVLGTGVPRGRNAASGPPASDIRVLPTATVQESNDSTGEPTLDPDADARPGTGSGPDGRPGTESRPGVRLGARLAMPAAVAGLVAVLAGPAAYALDTVGTPHTGAIVTAGPAVAGARGGPGGFPGGPGAPGGGAGGPGAAPGGGAGGRGTGDGRGGAAFPGGSGIPGGTNGQGVPPGGTGRTDSQGLPGGQAAPGGQGFPGGAAGGRGGMGGLLGGREPSAALVSLLAADADRYTWMAAAVGANNAASYQLATQRPVMAIGGFNGSDPAPTLAEFQKYVAEGRIHYLLGGGAGGMGGAGSAGGAGDSAGGIGGMGGSMGGSSASREITAWVAATFTATTVDDTVVYDLTSPR